MTRRKESAITIQGDIAYVDLTLGFVAVIDAADVRLVAGRSWRAQRASRCVYAVAADFSTGRRTNVAMHRLLMGQPEGLQIDHRDGDGLNNLRANLRLATRAQNQHNKRTPVSNTSGFKGVRRSRSKWMAQIKLNGTTQYLGTFDTPETAAAAYAKASAELHGEFGRTA